MTINNVIKQFPLLPVPLLSSNSSNRFADVRCDARRLATNLFTYERFHIPMTIGGWCGWLTIDELCNQRDFIPKTYMTLISIDFVYGIILSFMPSVCCTHFAVAIVVVKHVIFGWRWNFVPKLTIKSILDWLDVHLLCHFNDFIVSCIAQ